MPKAIILNPSWEAIGRIHLEALMSPHNRDDFKQTAHDEIIRGLRGYDALLRAHTDYFEPKEVEVD